MSAGLPRMAGFEQSLEQPLVEVDVKRRRQSSRAFLEPERKGLEDKGVSEAEIRQHKSHDDAWVVVDGIVYDISRFVATHPGGSQVIVKHLLSKDIGKVMRGEESDALHSHSQYAFRMLQQFNIGRVRDSSSTRRGEDGTTGLSGGGQESKYTVDLNQPLVFQVGKLGDDYEQWVHDPIVQKEPPRFFESDIAEFFTKTAWWVIPIVWGPWVVYLAMAAHRGGLWLSAVSLGMVAGAFIWTFIEYLLHRFVFHMKTSRYWTNTAHYFLHGFHHKHPMDGTRLVFPPAITGIIIVMIWYVTEPLGYIVGRPMKLSMVSGGLLMYIAYDLTHYFLHFGTSFNNMSSKLKDGLLREDFVVCAAMTAYQRFHLNHHFRDQANSYGVTTPFWDTVFDTFPKQANKTITSRPC